MASFNYGGIKARDAGRIVDVIRATLCLLVSPMIIERKENLRFFFFNWGGNIVFDSNCREYSQCCLYHTSELEKNLSYKGLRLAGLIILE